METKTNKVSDLYGRLVCEPWYCDGCPSEREDCRKVSVAGVGELCLVENPMLWHPIAEEPKSGTYLVHELWGRHRYVIIAEYDSEEKEWRPWEDIQVAGMPLNEVQLSKITHWMPLMMPVLPSKAGESRQDGDV